LLAQAAPGRIEHQQPGAVHAGSKPHTSAPTGAETRAARLGMAPAELPQGRDQVYGVAKEAEIHDEIFFASRMAWWKPFNPIAASR